MKTDVYAYGILLFEICSGGAVPLADVPLRDIAVGRRDHNLTPELPADAPDILVEVCQMCWEKDPDLRPTFKMIARKLQRYIAAQYPDQEEPGSPGIESPLTTNEAASAVSINRPSGSADGSIAPSRVASAETIDATSATPLMVS